MHRFVFRGGVVALGLDRRRRGGVGHLARLSADRADPHQGQVRAGRGRFSQAPLAVLQEDADRARLRRQAQRAGLHGLFRPAHRRLAEELDLHGPNHAVGRERPGAALRRLRREVSRDRWSCCWKRAPRVDLLSFRGAAKRRTAVATITGSHKVAHVPWSCMFLMPHQRYSGLCPILPAIVAATTLAGCMKSTEPVFGPDTRVLPFTSPLKIEGYQPTLPTDPWKPAGRATLVADHEKVAREVDESGVTRPTTYTFHALGPQRFIVQANFGNTYGYGLLEIGQGEGHLFMLDCWRIDRRAFLAAGGTVETGLPPGQMCVLDNVKEPGGGAA